MEINPLLVLPGGAVALDARVVLSDDETPGGAAARPAPEEVP